MQAKDERIESAVPASETAGSNAILSDDPTKVVVDVGGGRLIDWESRKGFGAMAQKLAYPERLGFHRHWFNDEPGRLEEVRNAGYIPVVDDEGAPVTRVVDKTTGMRAYLHEIPDAWYKADLKVGQDRADGIERAVRAGNAPAPSGVTPGIDKQNFYGDVKLGRR